MAANPTGMMIACPDCDVRINRDLACGACVKRLTEAMAAERASNSAALRVASDAVFATTHNPKFTSPTAADWETFRDRYKPRRFR